MTQLLAHIEAGIDFVEEEDIQFVTRDEVVATLDALIADLGEADADEVDAARGGRPHVACAGLPNAGKSTLFNALVGYERALVSPVLGTTRDVLAAEVELDGVVAVFQDCAGLGASADEIALASHLATERTMQLADLVLWVHAADMPWDERETAACAGIEPDRRVLVLSKVDLASRPWGGEIPVNFPTRVGVCALNGTGMGELRATLARRLATGVELPPDELRGGEHRLGVAALRRARDLADSIQCELLFSDLIALELRAALAVLARETHQSVSERLLDHIFAEFCVGK